MQYINKAIYTLGKNEYWSDKSIYNIVKSYGLSPYSSVGQRLLAIARIHNYYISQYGKNKISAIFWLAKDYLSSFTKLNKTINARYLVEKSLEIKDINTLNAFIISLKNSFGISKKNGETKQNLECIFEARDQDIKNYEKFYELFDDGNKYGKKYHKDNDILKVLNGKSETGEKEISELEDKLTFVELVQYYTNCKQEEKVKEILQKNEQTIIDKFLAIVAQKENSDQRIYSDIIKRNKKIDRIEQKYDNDIDRKIQEENYTRSDKKLERIETTNTENILLRDNSVALWWFWLLILFCGLGLFLPVAFSFGTYGFLVSAILTTSFGSCKLTESYINFKNSKAFDKSYIDAKLDSVKALITNPNEQKEDTRNVTNGF